MGSIWNENRYGEIVSCRTEPQPGSSYLTTSSLQITFTVGWAPGPNSCLSKCECRCTLPYYKIITSHYLLHYLLHFLHFTNNNLHITLRLHLPQKHNNTSCQHLYSVQEKERSKRTHTEVRIGNPEHPLLVRTSYIGIVLVSIIYYF